MIKGFRFTNQLASAEVDARIHQELLNQNDGIFYGMDLSYTSTTITIAEGLCEIAGRPIAVIDSETVTASTNTLYCLLVLELDLSADSTETTFNQANFKILTSSSSYPSVTQQDINIYGGSNTLYQLEFARFKTTSAGISSFEDTRSFLNFDSIYAEIQEDCETVLNEIKEECASLVEQIETDLASVEDGSAYLLKTGGEATGDYTIDGNIEANEITADSVEATTATFATLGDAVADSIEATTATLGETTADSVISDNITNSDGSSVIYKDNFAIITGSISVSATTLGTKTISYPTGFDSDSIVVSFGLRTYTTKGYSYGYTTIDETVSSALLSGAIPRNIALNSSSMTMYAYNFVTDSSKTLYYKIVLMNVE